MQSAAGWERLLSMKRIFSMLLAVGLVGASGVAAAPAALYVEGYAGAVSVAQGQPVGLHVSVGAAAVFDVEVARLGAERVVVWGQKNVPGAEQPVPEDASANGCGWPETLKVPVGADWRPGYYEVTLKAADAGGKWTGRGRRTAESTAFFIVRAAKPGSESKILLQLATNTYNAYNNWGGFSVYAYNGLGKNQGHRVSFDRPAASQFSRWERPFVQWAEAAGYELEYAANGDLEARPELLEAYKLVLSVGHDEYWSAPMRDHLEAFIGRGGNVAFFSGNTCCWQIRMEDEGRAFTCWKQSFAQDPVYQTADHATLSTLWGHHLVKRPENQLTGVGFLHGGYRNSHGQFMGEPAEFTVHRPGHWMLEGTGLKAGDRFGAKDTIVGYECDGSELEWRDGLPFPTGKDGTPASFEVLATCPVRWHPDDAEWYERWEKGRTGNACLGAYTRGGTVVTSGTTDWAHGLAGGDAVVIRVTRNVLDRLGR